MDNDQGFLGTHVLTSATKKVDVGRLPDDQARALEGVEGRRRRRLQRQERGVGYGKVTTKAPNRVALVNLLGKWSKDIASGKVKPPRTVKG